LRFATFLNFLYTYDDDDDDDDDDDPANERFIKHDSDCISQPERWENKYHYWRRYCTRLSIVYLGRITRKKKGDVKQ